LPLAQFLRAVEQAAFSRKLPLRRFRGFARFTLAWYGNISGPPPRDPHTAPYASFVLFSLAVAWAYWMNRLRPKSV
jgi:hypothetical protein